MRTVRNILAVVAVSAFLFACEAEDYANDDTVIEDVRAEGGELDEVEVREEDGDDSGN